MKKRTKTIITVYSIHVDTSVKPNATCMYSIGNLAKGSLCSSFSGFSESWNSGDIVVYNTTTAEVGSTGSKYIVLGWKRGLLTYCTQTGMRCVY